MPHSTGGGGSHGGSHSSSSFGGGGGGGGYNSTSFYNSYAPGRHVWVTYVNGQPRYRYANRSYRFNFAASLVGAFLILTALPPVPAHASFFRYFPN